MCSLPIGLFISRPQADQKYELRYLIMFNQFLLTLVKSILTLSTLTRPKHTYIEYTTPKYTKNR